jgi:hypothetical protein
VYHHQGARELDSGKLGRLSVGLHHRTSLIDLRLLRLLLRQFDVWYTIANMGKWGSMCCA